MHILSGSPFVSAMGASTQQMETRRDPKERILVVGGPSPLLEGVSDLLQLAGYRVNALSTWAEAEKAIIGRPPHLAVVDPSVLAADPPELSVRIAKASGWTGVPILCVGFPNDTRIQELRRRSLWEDGLRVRFYTHTLQGTNGLLEAVKDCLA